MVLAKDYIYGQNWVEQFRFNRRNLCCRPINRRYLHPDEDIFELYPFNPKAVVYEGFEWDQSPQGHSMWSDRKIHLPSDLESGLFTLQMIR